MSLRTRNSELLCHLGESNLWSRRSASLSPIRLPASTLRLGSDGSDVHRAVRAPRSLVGACVTQDFCLGLSALQTAPCVLAAPRVCGDISLSSVPLGYWVSPVVRSFQGLLTRSLVFGFQGMLFSVLAMLGACDASRICALPHRLLEMVGSCP